jgi:alpha-D-xyloside xylohydrolase
MSIPIFSLLEYITEMPTFSFSPREQFQLDLSPFQCRIGTADAPTPTWKWVSVRARWAGNWVPLDGTQTTLGEQTATILLANPNYPDLKVHLTLTLTDGLLDADLLALGEGVEALAVDFVAGANEHYLGFGERFNRIDQRGQEVDLWVTNGASGGLAYKPVPFMMSSAGYAARLMSSARTLVRLARSDDPGVVSIRCESAQFHFQVWTGHPFEALLERYAALIGLPFYEPPSWVFGPWKSRDWTLENQSTVEEDLRLPRQYKLAGSVKLIDAAWESAYNSFEFNQKFPDPATMIAEARRSGYRMILWISPWMHQSDPPSPVYQFCADQGFLIRNPQGKVYVHRLANSPDFSGSCFDFTNPAAAAWWQAQIERLVDMGVDGFKTDFGEQVPADAVFFDGSTGRHMHNLFPVLYNQVTYAALSRKTHGILLARSAWEGSQRVSAIWAGDQSADFGPATGLPSVILAGQNAGLSGFAIWASDVGGYFSQPSEEVFARWIEFGAFSPMMQIHGMGCHEPWNYSAHLLEIYRRYAQVHTDLFPYIFTFARKASATGLPIMRAMAFAFPDDPHIWDEMVEHQYGFGSELLVAPVYSGPGNQRRVYLPFGEWLDFWTGHAYNGGQAIRVQAELDQIPVFARAGAVIPLLDPSPETLLPADDPEVRQAGQDLRLQVYPGADRTFEMYDGSRYEWQQAQRCLRVSRVPAPRWLAVRCMSDERSPVRVATATGQPVEIISNSLGGDPRFVRFQVTPAEEYWVQF